MARCMKLRNNFYSMDLYYGKTMLRPYRNFHCFFIVENSCGREFMHQQALQLLMSQCNYYDFYGSFSRELKGTFEEMEIMLNPRGDEKIALARSWESLDDFIEALNRTLSLRPFIPFDIYLIYDDEEIYKTVLQKLKE